MANYLKELSDLEDMAAEREDDTLSLESEEEELNQDLIDWLIKWEKEEELRSRGGTVRASYLKLIVRDERTS